MRTLTRGPASISFSVFAGVVGCAMAWAASDRLSDPYRIVSTMDSPHLREPSGLCWHEERGTLFVVGDRGDVYEFNAAGALIFQRHLRKTDLEGIAYDPRSGLLYAIVEGEDVVLEIHPDGLEVLRRFVLPRLWQGEEILGRGSKGVEGITFVPDPLDAEGGVWWIANQSKKRHGSLILEVDLPLRDEAGAPRIRKVFYPDVRDLAGLCYDDASGRVWVVSDKANRVLEVSRDGRTLQTFALPGDNQEGIAVDNKGCVYIAQDSGGILKLERLGDRAARNVD